MFHINKSISRIACITSVCFLTLTTPIFATPVSDTATHNILTNIYDRLGTMWTNYMVPIYTVETRFFGTTYTLDSLYNIISAVGSQTSDVSSKLVTTNNYLSNISGYTDGIEGSLSTINSNLVTYTEHVQGYLHDVSWKTLNTNFEFSHDNITYYSLSDFTNTSSDRVLYIKIYSQLNSSQYLSYLRIPFNSFTDIKLSYYRATNSTLYENTNFNYATFYGFRNIDLFILPFNVYGSASYPTILKIEFTSPFFKATNGEPELFYKYLTPDMQDYYSVENLIYNYNQNKILDDFKYLYASDDIVAAKQNQQSYEDQAISDFTGSGSAAASGSDATSLKNISGSLKSGLNSGGSISNALGVFNDSSDLWKWFSQDNYNDINGQPSRSDNGIIDFYHINQDELQELLNDSNR